MIKKVIFIQINNNLLCENIKKSWNFKIFDENNRAGFKFMAKFV